MNSESSTNPTATSTTPLEHSYYEVGGEMFDKTNALSALIECAAGGTAIVLCATKAESDLIEVVLKKRGVVVAKPNVELPTGPKLSLIKQVQNGEISVLVVTDTLSTGFDPGEFNLLVNYSIPADPEVYLHRMERIGAGQKLAKVASLVGPNDQANFQFIRKVVGIQIDLKVLPTGEDLFLARAKSLSASALKDNHLQSDTLRKMVEIINGDANRDQIIALLLHNTVNVLPSVKRTASESSADRGGDFRGPRGGDREDRGNRTDYRDDRGERTSRGGDRNDRRDSRSDRGRGLDRGGDRGGDRGPRRRDDFGGEGRNEGYGDSNPRFNEGDGDERFERRERREPPPPPQVDVRFYVGHGLKEGFNQQELTKVLTEQCQLSSDQIKRFSLRDCYSFVDIAEGPAREMETKLESAALSTGKKLFMRRATSISTRAERTPDNGGSEHGENGTNGASEMSAEQPVAEETVPQ